MDPGKAIDMFAAEGGTVDSSANPFFLALAVMTNAWPSPCIFGGMAGHGWANVSDAKVVSIDGWWAMVGDGVWWVDGTVNPCLGHRACLPVASFLHVTCA